MSAIYGRELPFEFGSLYFLFFSHVICIWLLVLMLATRLPDLLQLLSLSIVSFARKTHVWLSMYNVVIIFSSFTCLDLFSGFESLVMEKAYTFTEATLLR